MPYSMTGVRSSRRYDFHLDPATRKTREVEELSPALSFSPDLKGASGDTLDHKTFIIKGDCERFPLARCGALEIHIGIGPDMNMPLFGLGFKSGDWLSK